MNVLLLTATITPPANVPGLEKSLSNPQLRAEQYLHSLENALQVAGPGHPFDHVVFAENSGSDLSRFVDLATRMGKSPIAEFISTNGLDHPPEFGRGYGEFKLIDWAIKSSPRLAGLNSADRIWKLTGRYLLLNASHLVGSAPKDLDLYADLKTYPESWVDLRFFGFSPNGHKQLIDGIYHNLSESINRCSAEKVIFDRWILPHRDARVYRRLNTEPRIDGLRGYDGRRYLTGRNYIKYFVRRAARKVAPQIWI